MEIRSDTAHPGDSLSEDLWEVDVLHPCRLCLSSRYLSTQAASPPAWLRLSALNKLTAPAGMRSHPPHLTSELHISLKRRDLRNAAQFDPFQGFSSRVLKGFYFPCVIVIFALTMTVNRSLIIPRFLLMQRLIRAREVFRDQ